ncbi:MAG: GIY-YIG nuclease family protein [Verrucomicrobiales bacterium]|nr:GIY-YIG nuclease family protein [Verrucomicrobiales bacterium]
MENGCIYVGSTHHLERRLQEHRSGCGCNTTSTSATIELICSETFPDQASALARERQLKGWSRVKKLALVNHKLEDLYRSRDLGRGARRFDRALGESFRLFIQGRAPIYRLSRALPTGVRKSYAKSDPFPRAQSPEPESSHRRRDWVPSAKALSPQLSPSLRVLGTNAGVR